MVKKKVSYLNLHVCLNLMNHANYFTIFFLNMRLSTKEETCKLCLLVFHNEQTQEKS